MTKFTDAQLVILSAAAQRRDRAVERSPGMPQAAWAKAARQLVKRKCLEETAATAERHCHMWTPPFGKGG